MHWPQADCWPEPDDDGCPPWHDGPLKLPFPPFPLPLLQAKTAAAITAAPAEARTHTRFIVIIRRPPLERTRDASLADLPLDHASGDPRCNTFGLFSPVSSCARSR